MASNVSSHRWPAESPGYVPKETGNSTLFSAFSLSRCIEIGHRQSCPVDECSVEKREALGMEKIHRGRNLTVDYTI